jgi:hypothetical protein
MHWLTSSAPSAVALIKALAQLCIPHLSLSREKEFSARNCSATEKRKLPNLSALFLFNFLAPTSSAKVLFEFRYSNPLYKSPHDYAFIFLDEPNESESESMAWIWIQLVEAAVALWVGEGRTRLGLSRRGAKHRGVAGRPSSARRHGGARPRSSP